MGKEPVPPASDDFAAARDKLMTDAAPGMRANTERHANMTPAQREKSEAAKQKTRERAGAREDAAFRR